MTERKAECSCGQLTVACEGDPLRVSVCRCLACQRRTGSVFGVQARWPRNQVKIEGTSNGWERTGDSGSKSTSYFCPACGSTVYLFINDAPEVIAVAIGAFADPGFPPPAFSVYEERKHGWVAVPGDEVEHFG